MDIAVRGAGEADLPAVLQLYAQPGLDDGSVLGLEAAKAIYRRFAAYPDYHLYVAVRGSEVVGTFALLIMDNLAHLGARSGVVEDVVVREDLRGTGIGRQMMEFARARCREAGCYKMALSSNLKREPAHRFYELLGFERHGFSFRIEP